MKLLIASLFASAAAIAGGPQIVPMLDYPNVTVSITNGSLTDSCTPSAGTRCVGNDGTVSYTHEVIYSGVKVKWECSPAPGDGDSFEFTITRTGKDGEEISVKYKGAKRTVIDADGLKITIG